MLKNFQIPIFITVFLICLLTGFAVTPRLWPATPESAPAPIKRVDCLEQQCNFVIIHVDDLESSSPSLTAVWAALVSLGSQPTLVLKPLYPSSEQHTGTAQLGSTFSLSPGGSLSPDFLQILDHLNFERRGYIILDNTAASALLSSATQAPILPDTLTADGDTEAVRSRQISLLNQLCTHLTTTDNRGSTAPVWSSLTASHLSTDLEFDAFIQNWERIVHSGPLTHCEIAP